jgi:hypothetical protein
MSGFNHDRVNTASLSNKFKTFLSLCSIITDCLSFNNYGLYSNVGHLNWKVPTYLNVYDDSIYPIGK